MITLDNDIKKLKNATETSIVSSFAEGNGPSRDSRVEILTS